MEIAYAAALQGTGYIFSLFPYVMMTTGVAGVVIVGISLHLLLGWVMGWIAQSIARASFWQLMIALKLFILFVAGGFIIGYLWSFFGIKTIALAAAYLILQFLFSGNKFGAVRSRGPHAT